MKKELITYHNSESKESEYYRILKANIEFSLESKKSKAVLFTSPKDEDGKSTTASNVAITLAQSNKRVVLLDCNLRNPALYKKFKIVNMHGLVDYILKGGDIFSYIKKTDVENLFVLTTGTINSNPLEIFESTKMTEIINSLKDEFEYIIIDSPAILAVSDAMILSKKVDGIVLVSTYSKTEKSDVVKAKNIIKKTRSKLIGIVINRIPYDELQYYNK